MIWNWDIGYAWYNSRKHRYSICDCYTWKGVHWRSLVWHIFSSFLDAFPGGSEAKASACNAGDQGSIPGSGRSPGEGNGNPLQYSCLENPMDGGAWWATIHRVAKSRTQLSYFMTSWCPHWGKQPKCTPNRLVLILKFISLCYATFFLGKTSSM